MYFGHLGVGFAAKAVAPRISIGVLLIGVTGLDLVAGITIGLEYFFPLPGGGMGWSHGLFMALIWTGAAFFLTLLALRDWKPALVMGLAVFSHWILDFISHPMGMGRPLPPDLPLFFKGSLLVGLGLYNYSPVVALITDLGLFTAGLAVYFLETRSVDRKGTVSIWMLVVFLCLSPLFMLLPVVGTILACCSALLLLPLGFWTERHRRMTTAGETGLRRSA